ncbi:RHS repeat-associated core domain-containing protein [Chitinophaga sp.]|uniref:RHS repeat-associated core domain-containing protein n=1 Tax=Chitinophaga sp. TaxID=1869181 RepID=UPI0031D57A8C
MLVSNKHFTPVLGLDLHIVILFGFPIPLPHPFIGLVVDPMDYVPFIGATTKINHVPRGKSDTSGFLIFLFHIPMGGPFLLAPMIGHDSVNFFGSKKVKVEGNLMSPSGHMLMTCNDIGLPLSLTPGKKFKPIPSLYLPTSFSIPLSFGKPVMVGGPFVPDWAGALLNLVMSFGFGAMMKGLGKGMKKLGKAAKKAKNKITKFNLAHQKKIGGSDKLSRTLCKLGFEPVDLVQGIVIYDGVDFELPGPVPLRWARSWNSDSAHHGLLGHGNHLAFDMRILEFTAEEATGLLLGDGRSVIFDLLPYTGDNEYNRHEKMTLTRTSQDEYQLFDHRERLYYLFKRLRPLDPECRLAAISDEAGFLISFHFNNKGTLLRVIDSVGRHLHIDSDTEGRITAVTAHHRDHVQRLVSYAYNEDGDLTEITDALRQTTYIHYQHHHMVKKTDRNGNSFFWEYDGKGRCIHTRGDNGVMEGHITYHPEAGYNHVTNAEGQTTTYYYTPEYLVTQIKDPLGYSRFTEYTEDGEIYREIDEEAGLTGYTYDDRGNRTGIVHPDGTADTFNYDDEDRLILATEPGGGSRTFIYYSEGPDKGLLHTLTEPDGRITIFRYNKHRLLYKAEDEQERITKLEYDEDYNLASITLPDGGHATWQYDVWGQCVANRNPDEQQQTFRYDALGRVTEIELPDDNRILFHYNAYDEVVEVQDKYQHARFAYTALGSLKMKEQNGAKVHLVYNRDEQLTSLVNEHGEMYRFGRNRRGDIIQETGFDGLTRHYQLDATGNIIRVQRPGGRWTECEYDYNGRLTRAEHSDGTKEIFAYNGSGQLISAANEHSTVRLQRDSAGRVTMEWQNGYTVAATYDASGRRQGLESSLGAKVRMARNALGDLTGITVAMEGIQGLWSATIQRSATGQELERILPGGIKSSWSYGLSGMPTSHIVAGNGRESRKRYYRWDAAQQLRSIVNGMNGATVKFGHNDFGNLAWAQYEDGTYDYRTADKAGNLFREQTRSGRKYAAGGQLTASEQARYVYDAEGNLARKIISATGNVWEYDWCGNGMLKKVTRPDGRTVEFKYDALGRRIEKVYNGIITRFVWDGRQLLHEWHYPAKERPVLTVDEWGEVKQSHPEPVPAEQLITWVFEDGTFSPAAKIAGGKQYSIINDYLGTPCAAYDETGEKVWECELDIYGKVRKLAGDSTFIPFRYPGQYEDRETGLYYNRFRYYSPEDGVYISQDPIRTAAGIKLYGYVDDVLTATDPLGLHQILARLVDPQTGKSTNFGQIGSKETEKVWTEHGVKGHSEYYLLKDHISKIPPEELQGKTLVIKSLGEPEAGYWLLRFPLPPCKKVDGGCDKALTELAEKHNMRIIYTWSDKGKFKIRKYGKCK